MKMMKQRLAFLHFWKCAAILSILYILFFSTYDHYITAAAKKKRSLSKYYLEAPLNIALNSQFFQTPETLYAQLNMPYYYLGKGKQAIAFASIDGQYVLKLLKWPKKLKKQQALLHSLNLAGIKLQSESGMLAIQYGPLMSKDIPLPIVEVMDKCGKITALELRKCLFVIQKKAPFSLKETLLRLKWQNRPEEAKQVLKAFFSLLSCMRSKEIIDLDGALIRNGNIALIKNLDNSYTPLSIDIGKYATASKNVITRNDVKRMKPFISWIKTAWPEILPIYMELQASYQEYGY